MFETGCPLPFEQRQLFDRQLILSLLIFSLSIFCATLYQIDGAGDKF
jgi:hypothetical protein